MLTAKSIMTKNPITITPETSIAEAVKILLERKFNGLPVVGTEGELLGVLCQSDLIAQQLEFELPSVFSILGGYLEFGLKDSEKSLKKMTALTANDSMSTKVTTVNPDMPIAEVVKTMLKSKIYTLPVIEDGKLVGIIGKEDVLKTLQSKEIA